MAERKLKSVLKTPITSLFLKATIFGFLLVLINYSHSWWWEILYLSYAVFLYFRYFKTGTNYLFFTLFSFVLISWEIALNISFSGWSWLVIIFLSLLLFVILGVKSFFFNKNRIYMSLFYYFLVFVVSSYFSANLINSRFFPYFLLVFLFFYFSFKEYISFMLEGFDKRKKVYSLAVALGMTQLLWISSLLSIGFLNSASLVLVALIASGDILISFFSGQLEKMTVYKSAAFFILFSFLILILPVLVP